MRLFTSYRVLAGMVGAATPLLASVSAAHAQDPARMGLEVQVLGSPDAEPAAAVSGTHDTHSTEAGDPQDAYFQHADAREATRAEDVGPPWGTSPGSWELGLFWGLFIPQRAHELYEASDPAVVWHRFEKYTPDLGLRAAWFPLRMLGFEVEGAFLPTQLRDTNQSVNLWAVRGHVILQAPTKSVVPFLLAGGGVLGVSSSQDRLGSDVDGTLHVGVGVKGYINERVALRLDVRDNITQGLGADKLAMHWEGLLGVSVVLCRPEAPKPPADTDQDGIPDTQDQCPRVVGVPPLGCPPPPPDSDADGIVDAQDACPTTAGVASVDPARNGCPPPPPDGDGDGVADSDDRCPTVAGDGSDGCLLDNDGDGIPNRDDKCVDQSETMNSFEDTDGCPDELPQAVKKFTGAIAGIVFEANKAVIRPASFKVLDEAAKVLIDYPTVRVEIAGHTDISGAAERNLQLSGERADAVKAYIVSKGVTDTRIQTRGVGSNEPVADNKTAEGRIKNRRVEFKLLTEQSSQPTAAPAPPALVPGQPAP